MEISSPKPKKKSKKKVLYFKRELAKDEKQKNPP